MHHQKTTTIELESRTFQIRNLSALMVFKKATNFCLSLVVELEDSNPEVVVNFQMSRD